MRLYQKTSNEFFMACAALRNEYGITCLDLQTIERGQWLTEAEIQDFTIAYMAGGEL